MIKTKLSLHSFDGRPMVPGPRYFRGYQTCQRLFGNLLVRKSYNILIRSRIFVKPHFESPNALFEILLSEIHTVGYSGALVKTPANIYICKNLCYARKILS